jgi:chromate transporter
MLAMLRQEFCERRRVFRDDEFQVLFGLSRMVPGMNLLALTVLLGNLTNGLLGSVLALMALSGPSLGLIVLGCVAMRGRQTSPMLDGVVRALGPTAAALVLHTNWQLSSATLKRQGTRSRVAWLAIAALTAAVTLLSPIHPGWLILASAVVGVACVRFGWGENPS